MIRRNSRSCWFAAHLFITGVLLMYAQGAAAVTLSQVQKLVGSDSSDGDHFSRAMDIDGDTIAVSATNVDGRRGAVYVFERNTGGALCPATGEADPWCEQARVTAADAESFERFGEAVAIEGDTLFVGARFDDANGDDPLVPLLVGSVYVFARAGGVWTQQAKLTASDAIDDVRSQFGGVLAVDGDVLAVSARNHPDGGTVYVFRNNAGGWIQEAKLSPPPGNSFAALSVSGNMLAIGATDDDVAINSGAVFVYEFDGSSWNFLQKVKADDAAADDIFGTSVEISGNQMIVAAPHFFEPRIYSGAAYIFELIAGSWVQQAKLTANDSFVGDAFGFGIGITGTTAIVTADRDDDFGVDSGSAYVYTRTPAGWVQTQKIYASGAGENGWFGTRLWVEGDEAVFTAWPIFNRFLFPGAAYVFQIDTDDDSVRDSLDNCPAKPNASQSDIDLDGVGDVCDVCPADATDNCDPGGQAAEEIDASAGGIVETSGGELALDIPADSLAGDTTVTVVDAQPDNPNVDLSIGPGAAAGTSLAAFDFGPDGTTFNPPAEVTFMVDVTALNQKQRDNLDVYRLNESTGTFESLGAICVITAGPPDIANCTVSLSGFSVYAIVAPQDEDGDGVPDNFEGEIDVCPDTAIPEGVPTKTLNPNHWALTDGDFQFNTKGTGSDESFVTSDTAGCSCEQIIEALGLGEGQRKHGCSLGTMRDWIDSL